MGFSLILGHLKGVNPLKNWDGGGLEFFSVFYLSKNIIHSIMESMLQAEFWRSVMVLLQGWMLKELPGIVIITIALFVLLKVVSFSMQKFKSVLLHRAENDDLSDSVESAKRINTLMGIIHGAIKVVLITMYVMMLLSKFGINVAPILASAGILGLAVGFGAQELVRDYISGFFMLLENQVRTGDVAIINGTGGLVEKIMLRTITLRDQSGVVHIFQNGKISTLSNMTKDWSAIVIEMGVAYKEDVDEVMGIMKKVGDDLQLDEVFGEHVIEPIEVMGLERFDDSAIVIKARIKTKPVQQWNIGREYRKRLKKAFDQNHIEIPFPHSTVYWGQELEPLKLEISKADKD
jgi:small conductance mechanosensitive channel